MDPTTDRTVSSERGAHRLEPNTEAEHTDRTTPALLELIAGGGLADEAHAGRSPISPGGRWRSGARSACVGVRRRPAERLHALFELACRLPQSPRRARSKVSTPDRIVALLGPRLVQLDHEEAWVLHVDPHLRLIGAPLRLSSGGAAGTDVPVARVPAEALRRSAT